MAPQPTYPANVREFARRLANEGDYSAYRIRQALQRRGFSPTEDTIRSWVDPDYAERLRLRKRNGRMRGPRKKHGWERRLDRMKDLRRLQLSYTAIANLMSHDFEDVELSEEQVRRILKGEMQHANLRRLLYPKGAGR